MSRGSRMVSEGAGRGGAPRPRTRWLAAATALLVLVLGPASAAFASGGTTTGGADLQVSGSASTGSPAPGTGYTYTFQVKNSGPDAASGVVLSDPLPTGTVYNFATANGSTIPCAALGNLGGGATVSCTLGSIAKGGQATVVVSVNAPLTLSSYPNTASVTSSSTDPSLTNNSATVTVTVKSGGGGANKGGINDTAPATAGPCAVLGNVSAPVGYFSIYAAIWNTFTVRSCSTSTQDLTVEVTETNVATGTVDYDVILPTTLTGGSNSSMVLDNDYAPFSTTYTVTMTVTDPTGAVLATASINTTTPPPQ